MNFYKHILFIALLFITTSISVVNAQQWKPAVLYLKNLPVPRIGTDTDAEIISDMEANNFFVLEVDCSGFPSTSPELENAIMNYYESACIGLNSYDSSEIDVDGWMVYLVPEGYRIATNISVWNIKEHGAEGSIDYIMQTYNEDIVPEYGEDYDLVEVTDPDDMRDRAGNPIDYNLRMDIVYPSGNVLNKVPLIMDHATVSPRTIPFSPCNSGEQLSTAIFPMGFLTSGYAWSIIDHCYNPLARKDVWGNFNRFTLDNWNGLASSTAFVRYVKSHLEEYNLNGKIGSMGLSKASYSALRLSNINNSNEAEFSLFNGNTNSKTQPWPGADSTIEVAYIAAGQGTRRIPQYADENSVPILTSAGANDQFDKWNEFPTVIKHLQDADLNHLALWMEDMGHNYPSMGTDIATGKNRYSLVKSYFDYYLKSELTEPLEVFYVFPHPNSSEVDDKGNSRILVQDVSLPGAMMDVSPYAPITVRFLSEINLSDIEQHVKVYVKTTNVEVPGIWTDNMGGTNFCFVPTDTLIEEEEYEIVIAHGLQNILGQTLTAEFVRDFTVSVSEEEAESNDLKISATEDTYAKHTNTTSPQGSELNMRVRYSQFSEWAFDGFLKFSIGELQIENIENAKLTLTTGSTLNENPINLNLFKTTTDWQESTLVSSNLPTYSDSPITQVLFNGNGNDAYVEFDITTALITAVANGEQSISFALRSSPGNKENIYFNTKEVENVNLRPNIIVKETTLGLNHFQNKKAEAYFDFKKKLLTYFGVYPTDLDIYDVAGRLILSKRNLQQDSITNLSHLKSGMYIAVFNKDNKSVSLKMIF